MSGQDPGQPQRPGRAPLPGAPFPGAPFPGAPSPGAPSPGAPFPGAPFPGAPACAPSFDDEIDAAARYEKGLAVKALVAIALVAVIIGLRVYFFG